MAVLKEESGLQDEGKWSAGAASYQLQDPHDHCCPFPLWTLDFMMY